jgi:hypothetical protein
MKQLSKLSPAETLFVLQDKNASIRELLKVTFMDLLLKQVIRTIEVQRQVSSKDAVRVYKYIGIGKNFWAYQPLPHENIILGPFQRNNSDQILFRHIVKICYQNAKSESKLHNVLRQSPNLVRCYSLSIIQSLFGGFSITTEGQELRNKVESEISQLEKQLPPLILNDHQKALDILKDIKGNIFLITNIEFDLLKQIDNELLAEMNKREDNNNDGGCSGCTWDSFDNYSESFDSSCSGDSGCSSGNAGCGGSGCSGCGGD